MNSESKSNEETILGLREYDYTLGMESLNLNSLKKTPFTVKMSQEVLEIQQSVELLLNEKETSDADVDSRFLITHPKQQDVNATVFRFAEPSFLRKKGSGVSVNTTKYKIGYNELLTNSAILYNYFTSFQRAIFATYLLYFVLVPKKGKLSKLLPKIGVETLKGGRKEIKLPELSSIFNFVEFSNIFESNTEPSEQDISLEQNQENLVSSGGVRDISLYLFENIFRALTLSVPVVKNENGIVDMKNEDIYESVLIALGDMKNFSSERSFNTHGVSIFMKNFLKVKNLPFNDNTVLRLDNIRDYLFNSENDIEVEISKTTGDKRLKKGGQNRQQEKKADNRDDQQRREDELQKKAESSVNDSYADMEDSFM